MTATLSCLGYVVIGANDLERWNHFATNLLGMQQGQYEPGKRLALRLDNYEQRILLEQGNDDDLRVAGWEILTEDDLERYVHGLRKLGIKVEAGNSSLALDRRVEKLYTCEDPAGFKHEFYYGPAYVKSNDPFRSKVLAGTGFKTGELGIGHILVRALDYIQTMDFCQRILGLRLSDRIRNETKPGVISEAAFFHTYGGRHHSFATGAIASPKMLGHLMVEVHSMDDVGMAYDRCAKEGLYFTRQLGHHPNDKMFSFYVESPSGFAIEFGYGGIVIDDESWKVRTYSQFSDWGHARLPRPEA